MGLLDDWIDLKWRYKAFMPLIAALPLIYFAQQTHARTSILLPFIGTVHFGLIYFYVIIPLIVMVVTNVVNQLGGLNGLETICPAIVIIGLMALSPSWILDGGTSTILANSGILQLSRQNLCGQLRIIRHRLNYCFVRSYFRFKIKLAWFDFAVYLQCVADTFNSFLHQKKSFNEI